VPFEREQPLHACRAGAAGRAAARAAAVGPTRAARGPHAGTYSNLVKQAKSKQKILDKMEADGLTPPVVHHRPFAFSFPDCDKLPPPVLPFISVSFAYSGREEDMLYRVRRCAPPARLRVCVQIRVCAQVPVKGVSKRHLVCVFHRNAPWLALRDGHDCPAHGVRRTPVRCGGASSVAEMTRLHSATRATAGAC